MPFPPTFLRIGQLTVRVEEGCGAATNILIVPLPAAGAHSAHGDALRAVANNDNCQPRIVALHPQLPESQIACGGHMDKNPDLW
jgi:hypothetical protein